MPRMILLGAFVFLSFILFNQYGSETSEVQQLMASEERPELVVLWPLDGVTIQERQVLSVSLLETLQPESYTVRWEIPGSEFGGPMALTENGRFEALVDVSSWDWQKDYAYAVHFTVSNAAGTVLANESTLVQIETPGLFAAVVPTPTVALSQLETTDPVPVVLGESTSVTLDVTWQERPATASQRFLLRTGTSDMGRLQAYWKASGGHHNMIFTKDPNGDLVTEINFFGWRWRGDGPYQFEFGLLDTRTQAPAVVVQYELMWQNGALGIRQTGRQTFPVVSAPAPASGSQPTTSPAVPRTPAAGVTPPRVVPPLTPTTTPPVTRPNRPVTTPVTPPAVVVPPAATTTLLDPTNWRLYAPPKPAVANSLSRLSSADQRIISEIQSLPSSIWLNGDAYETNDWIRGLFTQADASQTVPTFVLYNVPYRDCGSYSSGGAAQAAEYRGWVDRLVSVFGDRQFILVIEPDALAMLNCLTAAQQTERVALIRYAAEKFGALPNGLVYIDAGHPFWVSAQEMKTRLERAGIGFVRGFSLNVSNYVASNYNRVYGNFLSTLLNGKHYVIDTSRNGQGNHPEFQWCNPRGRGLGELPTMVNDDTPLDAYLWIKFPGESDGSCNGGPTAGQWWPEYALELYRNRSQR